MSLLRSGIRSTFALRTFTSRLASPLFLRDYANHFSTEAEQPPSRPEVSSGDQFPQTPGVAYGRLFGSLRHTLKTDIINQLEGCDLGVDDIRFSYNRGFNPNAALVQFPSREAYENAFRVIARKGRIYRMQKAERTEWELHTPSHGKSVLLQGLPHNVNTEDIDRFLSGCDFDPAIQFISLGFSARMAVVKFASQVQAMNACISKNGGFCLNSQVWMRVIQ